MDKYLNNILARCQGNFTVFDAFTKADSVINNPKYKSIVCSISGGADSDAMLDLIYRVDRDNKVRYVWFDTGLEYQVTKDHLKYLEERYSIKIEHERAIKPIPLSCKLYGQPFISKQVSEFMSRLQRNGFEWEDAPYADLLKKYPNCKSALKWWCNNKTERKSSFDKSRFDISHNKWLKEFIVTHHPTFPISNICCKYAKKDVSHEIIKRYKVDLMIIGVRKAEGGSRATAYKNCYTINESGTDYYRPLFWFSGEDKAYYNHVFSIKNSDCYEKWGLKRTGCVGCPYSLTLFEELQLSEKYDPNITKACKNIFKDAYAYTQQYREFVNEMNDKSVGLSKLF